MESLDSELGTEKGKYELLLTPRIVNETQRRLMNELGIELTKEQAVEIILHKYNQTCCNCEACSRLNEERGEEDIEENEDEEDEAVEETAEGKEEDEAVEKDKSGWLE